MATSYSPSKTPSRRVLGDLTPKAINTPSSQSTGWDPSQAARAQSPLKHITSQGPSTFVDKENLANLHAYSQGKKRGIDEVDSAEIADNIKIARGRGDSLMGPTRLTTDAMHMHTQNNPVGLANPGSPTERNTPTPEPEMMQDSQKSNQSFSDLLNYEMCASQKSEHGIPLEPARTAVSATTASQSRKSRAEQLRTRLKFGLYKVKTNQVGKRDADIISTYEATVSYAPNASRSTGETTSIESFNPHHVPNITVSSPHHEQRPVFVEANLDPFRPIGKLGAAPVMFLPPSDGLRVSSHSAITSEPSSSPPGTGLPNSVSPEQLMSPVKHRSNHASQMGEYDEADIDAREVSAHRRLQRLKEQQYLESDVTSSAVKGNAAKGLLELMHATR
ncbi:hypothetical protein T440DRAFT_490050 [Plenodomus tracheiphilus IPT5]|uniref:Uncharacterized protein n=1 Tax=Plenodomus tracheiphilus IPT5 TaxID=1408161 RepID=A0A6A7B3S7_9PLEO|nr:hypothetical protein T440DRAFT_490050 [Plenodomus tracheiphilus IPT5]